MSLHITVDSSRLNQRLNNAQEWLSNRFIPIMAESAQIIANAMFWMAPYKTGQLAGSISVERKGDRILVGPTVPYAYYVSKGTRPSPGRFVPAIGKRLVNPALPSFGMHPGIVPNRFIEEAVETTREQFAEDLQRKTSEAMRRI